MWPWTGHAPFLNLNFFYKTPTPFSQEVKSGRSPGTEKSTVWAPGPSPGSLWVKKPQEKGTEPRLLPQGPWRNHITATTTSTIPRQFPLLPLPGQHLLPTAGCPHSIGTCLGWSGSLAVVIAGRLAAVPGGMCRSVSALKAMETSMARSSCPCIPAFPFQIPPSPLVTLGKSFHCLDSHWPY